MYKEKLKKKSEIAGENLIYIGNLFVQTKTVIKTKRTYPVFLIAEKVPSL